MTRKNCWARSWKRAASVRSIVDTDTWAAFGAIAAEADLARLEAGTD